MIHRAFFFMLVLYLVSCSDGANYSLEVGNENKNVKIDSNQVSNPDFESNKHDKIDLYNTPDTNFHAFSLLYNKDEKYLPLIESLILKENDELQFPQKIFSDTTNNIRYILVFHPGGTKNQISELIIEPITINQNSDFRNFKTNNEIFIGMEKSDFTSRYEFQGVKLTFLENAFSMKIECENHPILNKYNMPEYYAKYSFSKGRLNKIAFGFAYP